MHLLIIKLLSEKYYEASDEEIIKFFEEEFRMVKELEPMLEKVLFNELLIASIEVKIPTKAIIPMAIINAVKTVRSLLSLIEPKATLILSLSFMLRKIPIFFKKPRIT